MVRLTEDQKTEILSLSKSMKPKLVAEQMGLDVKTVNYVKWSEAKKAAGINPFPKANKNKLKAKPKKKSKKYKARAKPLDLATEDLKEEEVTETVTLEGTTEIRFGYLMVCFMEAHFKLLELGFEMKYEKP